MKRTAKTFERGEAVEIQRDRGAVWESATYRDSTATWPDYIGGWHEVELPADAKPHIVYDGDGEVRFHTPLIRVPSRRIRKRSAK